jgi:tetratricopeptide (TPR) repeat protein
MSRFGNLEFEQPEEHSRQPQSVLKDEGHYVNAANEAFAGGRFEEALRYYSKVLEFNPNNSGAWSGQVRMLIELMEFREAKMWADKALERFPNEPELLAAKAVALARIGDLENAMAFSDASIEERGNTPYVWLARADVLLANREKRADYCFEKALALDSRNWFWHWLAARVACYYKRFSTALRFAQQALALETGRSMVWLQLGLCQQALGLAGEACRSFEQAVEIDPQCGEAKRAHEQSANPGMGSRLAGFWRRSFGV